MYYVKALFTVHLLLSFLPSSVGQIFNSDFSIYVSTLTKSNFSEITSHPSRRTVVMFYAPWCTYSKTFLPLFEEAAAIANANDGGILFSKVDCVSETTLYWQNKIDHYPTIKFYIDGYSIQYKGDLELDPFLDYLMKIVNGGVTSLETNYKSPSTFLENSFEQGKPILLISIIKGHNLSTSNTDPSLTNSISSVTPTLSDDSGVHTSHMHTIKYLCRLLESISCAVTASTATTSTLLSHHQRNNNNLETKAESDISLDGAGGEFSSSLPVIAPGLSLHILRPYTPLSTLIQDSCSTSLSHNPSSSLLTDKTAALKWVTDEMYPTLIPHTASFRPLLFNNDRPGYETHVVVVLDLSEENRSNSQGRAAPVRVLGSTHRGVSPSSTAAAPSLPPIALLQILQFQAQRLRNKAVFAVLDASIEDGHTTGVLEELRVQRGVVLGNTGRPSIHVIRSARTTVSFYSLRNDTDLSTAETATAVISDWLDGVLAGKATVDRLVLAQGEEWREE